ncbi:hypothetical protein [Microcoleus sp. D3_18a_C4]|uniref:hypothetical protein n=1 Tax=unclassified Microcoleus TaxID=2642155 RepID=UPI002FCE7E0E
MALHLGVPVVAHMKLLRINCKAHHLIPDLGMLHRKEAVDFYIKKYDRPFLRLYNHPKPTSSPKLTRIGQLTPERITIKNRSPVPQQRIQDFIDS